MEVGKIHGYSDVRWRHLAFILNANIRIVYSNRLRPALTRLNKIREECHQTLHPNEGTCIHHRIIDIPEISTFFYVRVLPLIGRVNFRTFQYSRVFFIHTLCFPMFLFG